MTDRRYPQRRRGGVLGAAVVVLGAAMLAAPSVPATAADDDLEPSPGESDTGRENACTPQQIEGGYEDLGGRCQLTGWNWDFGPCRYDVDVGELGDISSSCEPSGCVTATCDGGGPTGPPAGDVDSDEFCLVDEEMPNECDIWDFCESVGGDIDFVGTEADGQVEHFDCTVPGGPRYTCERHVSGVPSSCLIVHEHPGPTTTPPGPLERRPGAVDDVAAPPADPDDEPSGPVGPVVTVDVDTGVILSDVAAPAGSSGDEPDESTVPAPTTTSGGFDMFDILVVPGATGEVASDEG